MREYIARAIKAEGLGCPVWGIELGEWSTSTKAILTMIAEKVCPKELVSLVGGGRSGPGEFELWRAIETAAEGRGGVLIIDEANSLMDVPSDAGVRIINGLRRFCDLGVFGVVLLDNGEIFTKLDPKKRPQLASRFDNWRVGIAPPSEDDIEMVMHAWGVFGRDERKHCMVLGKNSGTLRNLTDCFRKSLEMYGEINILTISSSAPLDAAKRGKS